MFSPIAFKSLSRSAGESPQLSGLLKTCGGYRCLPRSRFIAIEFTRYEEEPEHAVALKISNANRHTADDGERAIDEHITEADPSQRGRALFRTFSECFEVAGPEGQHLCLAYEPMREPFWLFQTRFKDGTIPLPMVKTYIRVLLVGLAYLHSTCRVAHTGIFRHPFSRDDRLTTSLQI